MNLLTYLQHRNGVAPASQLIQAGFSRHRIQQEVARGALLRPRKGWLALTDADPMLLLAAKHNVVLSCVTQAKRLGLWVLHEDQIHVAARHPNCQSHSLSSITHWNSPLLQRPPGIVEDRIENVLALVATCQPRESAITIWDSALNKGMITVASLQRLPLIPRMRDVLHACTPYADSGLESLFRTRLRWLRVPIRAQVWLLNHRVDFLIGDRLVVQIDGRQHQGAQRQADMKHDAWLSQEGFFVMRFSYAQIVHDWPEVQDLIVGSIARGMHLKQAS